MSLCSLDRSGESMNANKLADELDTMLKAIGLTDNRVPTMLRQQQAEIAALKYEKSSGVYDFEPVAWMQVHYKDNRPTKFSKVQTWEDDVPLYTHPAKGHDLGISHAIGFDDGFKAGMQRAVEMNVVRTLTDEEIANTWDDVRKEATLKSSMKDIQDFARAILRKAQEK